MPGAELEFNFLETKSCVNMEWNEKSVLDVMKLKLKPKSGIFQPEAQSSRDENAPTASTGRVKESIETLKVCRGLGLRTSMSQPKSSPQSPSSPKVRRFESLQARVEHDRRLSRAKFRGSREKSKVSRALKMRRLEESGSPDSSMAKSFLDVKSDSRKEKLQSSILDFISPLSKQHKSLKQICEGIHKS